MIIKAKHHFFLDPLIRSFVIRKINRTFEECHFITDFKDRGKPVLLVCNHISWWDGIWALHFNQKYLHRKFHFMMLEEQLKKNWYFKYTGGFSVRKKSRSVVETINYTAQLLSNKNNLVLLFPSGKIQSIYNSEFKFEKGIERILQKSGGLIQVIFMANLIDYFSNPKPSLFCFTEEYSGSCTTSEMEIAYNNFYRECISHQSEKSD